MRTTPTLLWMLFGGALLFSCSEANQEGPDVTCADLECGRINACQEGIIAQCLDGVTVRYHVCGPATKEADPCDYAWQAKGAYRCTMEATDCEGCRPERIEGCGVAGDAGGGGAGGG